MTRRMLSAPKWSLQLGLIFLAAALVLGACGGAPAAKRPPRSQRLSAAVDRGAGPGIPRFSHVFLVVMENEPFSSALQTPAIDTIAHRYAYVRDSYAASHPSLPNYLALTAGSTFNITSDCLGCYVRVDNLGAELSRAKVSWRAYFQSLSQSCYLGTSYGLYAAKHNRSSTK
jgi:hypothetical protein